jgi:hypothetical protein
VRARTLPQDRPLRDAAPERPPSWDTKSDPLNIFGDASPASFAIAMARSSTPTENAAQDRRASSEPG